MHLVLAEALAWRRHKRRQAAGNLERRALSLRAEGIVYIYRICILYCYTIIYGSLKRRALSLRAEGIV